ncbi:MAG: hypothetical protein VYE29_02820 [Pseudomonadota bacterium]|nr:hypothetical protein [Pseudomonadota bacterium]
MTSDRTLNVAASLVLMLGASLQVALLTPGHNWGGDFSAYIMQAISIVEGTTPEFVARNQFAMENSYTPAGPVTYPWGFPLLLAPVYAVFQLDLLAFKLLEAVIYQVFLVVLWFGLAGRLSRRERFFILAIFAFNPFLLRFANHILSDIPFLLFSTLALVLIDRVMLSPIRVMPLRDGAVIGLAIAAAFLMRSNGALLILVFLLACILAGRQWRLLTAGLASYLSICVLIMIWLPDVQSSYMSQTNGISIESIADNVAYYALLMRDFFAPTSTHRWLGAFVFIVTLPVFACGLFNDWRRSPALWVYSALTLGLFVVWPFQQGLRFLFPILPVYVYYCLVGLRMVSPSISSILPNVSVYLPAALVLLFLLSSASLAARNLLNGRPIMDGPYTSTALDMFNYLIDETGHADLIIFRKPRVMRMMTDRDSIALNDSTDWRSACYWVLDRRNLADVGYFDAFAAGIESGELLLAYNNEQFYVYRRKKCHS